MRILLGLLCACLVYGIDTNPVRERIISVDSKQISFRAGNLKIGQSGIVLTHKEGYNAIVANALIVDINDGIAYASYEKFDVIKQKYLPTPTNKPKVDDEVLFGGFYNKSIAIAPDQESYNKILSLQSRTEFLHIDVFGAFLAKDSINDPKPKHFKSFCNIYSVGLVYILATNGVNVLDCQSFSILEEIPFEKPNLTSTQSPFFSRIAKIETGSIASKLRSKKSKNYFAYYDKLLKAELKIFHSRGKE